MGLRLGFCIVFSTNGILDGISVHTRYRGGGLPTVCGRGLSSVLGALKVSAVASVRRNHLKSVVELVDPLVQRGDVQYPVRGVEPHVDDDGMSHEVEESRLCGESGAISTSCEGTLQPR